jgi:hypothetical protein
VSAAAKRLGQILSGQAKDAAAVRWLTVGTVVTAVPLTVAVDNTATAAANLSGYVPVEGDVVLVAALRGAAGVGFVVLGKLGTPTILLSHTFDGGVDTDPVFGSEAGSGTPIAIQGSSGTFTTAHNGGSGLAAELPAISVTGPTIQRRQFIWDPTEDIDAADISENWLGPWCEVRFAFAFTGFPNTGRVQIFRFYPACALYLSAATSQAEYRTPADSATYTPLGPALSVDTRYEVVIRLNRAGGCIVTIGGDSRAVATPTYFGGSGDLDRPQLEYGVRSVAASGVLQTFGVSYVDNLAFEYLPGM